MTTQADLPLKNRRRTFDDKSSVMSRTVFLVLDVEPLIDRIKNYAKNKLLCRINSME